MEFAVAVSLDLMRLKELPPLVHLESARLFLFVNYVWACARGDADRVGGKLVDLASLVEFTSLRDVLEPLEFDRTYRAKLVRYCLGRRHAFDDVDALLECLLDFLMVEAVSGRILQTLAINERYAAPAANERDKVRLLAGSRGALAFLADLSSVIEKLGQHGQLLRVECLHHAFLAKLLDDLLVLVQHLFDLYRIVRKKLGRGVDTGQAAADDDGGQTHLKVRERIFFERTGKLQRHKEIARLANAANEVILHRHDGRAACTGGDRDVVKAVFPRVLDRQCAAEANPAVSTKPLAA